MKRWLGRNWLLLVVGIGLMLASSGIDGVYMARWQPSKWGWLGLVLNTMMDIASPVLTYKYGCLNRNSSKRRAARILLASEIVAVWYSWFFGWRQLLVVMPIIEPNDYKWVAPMAAAAIPLTLAGIGYAMSLDETVITRDEPAKPKVVDLDKWRELVVKMNGDRTNLTANSVNEFLKENGYETKAPSTATYWAKVAKGMTN